MSRATPFDEPARAPHGGQLSPAERWLRLMLLFALLYVFLVAVDLLGTGIRGLGEDFTDRLFAEVASPISGLAVGILATVLVQSSSVTTSTIVALVGTGVIGVDQAVPMVMGANIGTTVTNTLASLGSIRRPEEFRRAFAGATMHDFFNVFAVIVLLPLEVAFGFMHEIAESAAALFGGTRGGEYHSPVKTAVGAGADLVESAMAAIFVQQRLLAVLLIVFGIATLYVTLLTITRTMRVVVAGAAERSLNAVLGRSGVLGILIGVVLTVSVQSSSISTSLLIPMIAAGVLSLENAYPVTLGANLGTTITAMFAALATPQIEGLQIAFVHLLFNLCGTVLFYPVPWLRRLPLRAARWTADQAVRRRVTVMVYLVVAFILLPLAGTIIF